MLEKLEDVKVISQTDCRAWNKEQLYCKPPGFDKSKNVEVIRDWKQNPQTEVRVTLKTALDTKQLFITRIIELEMLKNISLNNFPAFEKIRVIT